MHTDWSDAVQMLTCTPLLGSSESSKAIFTTVALLRNIYLEQNTISFRAFFEEIDSISPGKTAWDRVKSIAIFAVPSFLYLVNNILYLVAIEFTTPALLQIAILAKVCAINSRYAADSCLLLPSSFMLIGFQSSPSRPSSITYSSVDKAMFAPGLPSQCSALVFSSST